MSYRFPTSHIHTEIEPFTRRCKFGSVYICMTFSHVYVRSSDYNGIISYSPVTLAAAAGGENVDCNLGHKNQHAPYVLDA